MCGGQGQLRKSGAHRLFSFQGLAPQIFLSVGNCMQSRTLELESSTSNRGTSENQWSLFDYGNKIARKLYGD